MGLCLLFPGQGTQHPAMFERLAGEPAAAPVLGALAARLGADPMALPEERLAENRNAQLLMVGHALALAAVLRDHDLELEPVVLAGYSVGEIAAHGFAGAFAPADALALAEERARCMDEAAAEPQGMLGLRGLPVATARALAEQAGAAVAIVNGPDHVVTGGTVAALDRLEALAGPAGAHVRRLAVRVASHTPLIAAAGPRFAAVLERTPWRPPAVPVLSGIDGRAVADRAALLRLLPAQLHTALDWARCLESAREYGATRFLELGPGRSLTRMVEETAPGLPARAWEDFRTPAGVAAWAGRGR
ncbi:acyltransferase domain-containing protein [Azospirillum sp. RWY-5-1]|uniref:Acyltransferase domain-containing protein n=1 Tax=Azospirillum oleiclasticum TaxID=2735135 RepID=A0ABX2T635_9PROT|nr:acyltransferase domain-containing protein [Azospirillum oleiclasticum]NYZ19708.1 acyltransferase domain-containing protein [Azospirillum oleiclasticum]